MNAWIPRTALSSTTRPPRRIGRTASGRALVNSSRRSDFTTTYHRMIFIDPPVDPAEPPTNIPARSRYSATGDHALKSRVAYPVVVTMAAAWKVAWRRAGSTDPTSAARADAR